MKPKKANHNRPAELPGALLLSKEQLLQLYHYIEGIESIISVPRQQLSAYAYIPLPSELSVRRNLHYTSRPLHLGGNKKKHACKVSEETVLREALCPQRSFEEQIESALRLRRLIDAEL